MLRTQMVVHRWGPKTRGLALFDRELNQSLVSFVMQAIKLNNAKETKFIYHNAKRCSMYLYQLNCGLAHKTTTKT